MRPLCTRQPARERERGGGCNTAGRYSIRRVHPFVRPSTAKAQKGLRAPTPPPKTLDRVRFISPDGEIATLNPSPVAIHVEQLSAFSGSTAIDARTAAAAAATATTAAAPPPIMPHDHRAHRQAPPSLAQERVREHPCRRGHWHWKPVLSFEYLGLFRLFSFVGAQNEKKHSPCTNVCTKCTCMNECLSAQILVCMYVCMCVQM